MSLKKTDITEVKRLMDSAKTFVIATHSRPDADTLGSALALARGLRFCEKHVTVISQDGVPDVCEWMPDAGTVETNTSDRGFDVAILCDCNAPHRTGDAKEIVLSAKSVMVVDHHAAGEEDCLKSTLCLSDTTSASTAELVFELLHGLHIPIDGDTAELLLAGMVGDTGGFRFSNVTPQTLEFASRLVALGASPSRAARELYESKSLANTRLLGAALLALKTEMGGRITWSQVTKEDFEKYGATDADTEAIVNHIRAVKGSEVGILFRELREDLVRVSLRSWGTVDVNAVANAFGGGGHVAAAGLTVEKKPLSEVVDAVLAEVRKWMAS